MKIFGLLLFTILLQKCLWTDIELAASIAHAISGGFNTLKGIEKEEKVDEYLFNIADNVTSDNDNLRIIP